MSEEQKGKKQWVENLKKHYRLIIQNIDTFEEVGSYNLSLLSVYTAISSAVVLLTIIVVSLIVFTPLKRYIPGYGDSAQLRQIATLTDKLERIEDEIGSHDTYVNNFKKMLVADVQTKDEVPVQDVTIPDSLLQVGKVEEDGSLRRKVEAEEKGLTAVNAVTAASSAVNFSPRDIPLEQMYFVPPVSGQVSSGVNTKELHYGIDIVAPKNTPIKVTMDGYVVASDYTFSTGNTIGVMHANNIVTYYKHCSALLKKAGDYVKAGEAIAIIGNTGEQTNGPHLHFEIWHKGKCINPLEYIHFGSGGDK